MANRAYLLISEINALNLPADIKEKYLVDIQQEMTNQQIALNKTLKSIVKVKRELEEEILHNSKQLELIKSEILK